MTEDLTRGSNKRLVGILIGIAVFMALAVLAGAFFWASARTGPAPGTFPVATMPMATSVSASTMPETERTDEAELPAGETTQVESSE